MKHLYEILDALKPIVEERLKHVLSYCNSYEGSDSQKFGIRRIFQKKGDRTTQVDQVIWKIHDNYMEIECRLYPLKANNGRRYSHNEKILGSCKTVRILHTDPDMVDKLVNTIEEFIFYLGSDVNPWPT